jgi:hypothetical protein
MIRAMGHPRRVIALLLVSLLGAGGCDSLGRVARDLRLPLVTATGKRLAAADRPYPAGLEIGEPLAIEVVRKGNSIQLDNRTVRTFEGAELWLNEEFGATVPLIGIGRGEGMSLVSFVNRYGDHYPVARFLRPELDRSLISAELALGGRLHKLTVRLEEDWREP